jgi:hypothetical protein
MHRRIVAEAARLDPQGERGSAGSENTRPDTTDPREPSDAAKTCRAGSKIEIAAKNPPRYAS